MYPLTWTQVHYNSISDLSVNNTGSLRINLKASVNLSNSEIRLTAHVPTFNLMTPITNWNILIEWFNSKFITGHLGLYWAHPSYRSIFNWHFKNITILVQYLVYIHQLSRNVLFLINRRELTENISLRCNYLHMLQYNLIYYIFHYLFSNPGT